jgi:predicted signal transduction protein with EAL and GGDEF domain
VCLFWRHPLLLPLASLKVLLRVWRLGFERGAVLCRCTLINSLTSNKEMIKSRYAAVSFSHPSIYLIILHENVYVIFIFTMPTWLTLSTVGFLCCLVLCGCAPTESFPWGG